MTNIVDAYPLSPTQQGMLFESLYASDPGGLYVEHITWDMRGELNVAAYRRAWEETVQRHSALRSAMVWESIERPLQVVRTQVRLEWQELDWRGESAEAQRTRFAALLDADRQRGFDLARAPLLRFTLVQVADDAFKFLWSFHHIILDGWSEPLILQEVLTCYEAFCRQAEPQLAPPAPYRDFIAWLAEQDPQAAEAFWRERLAGFNRPTPLPLEGAAVLAPVNESSFAELERQLTLEFTRELHTFLRAQKLTLNTLVQGAWGLLLARYSGEQDVAFGNVVAGRPATLPQAERIIGLLVNTLPVRVRVAPEQTASDWLRALQEQESAARAHEHVALVDVLHWSEAARGGAGTPLFESLVAVENLLNPVPTNLQGLLEFREIKRHSSRASYPLVLGIVPGRRLSIGISYAPRRLDVSSAQRLLDQFEFILQTLIADANRPLRQLPLLSSAERQLLTHWNDTAIPFSKDLFVHILFSRQAQRTLAAIALVSGDVALSFEELETRSNRLANWLMRQTISRGDIVALLLERSANLMVVLLGVLKTGAAYLPIDPENPAARVEQFLREAGVRLLLTDSSQHPTLQTANVRRVNLDQVRLEFEAESAQAPPVNSSADDLAYILYTSGSTGTPKGVAISHGSLSNHCQATARHYQLSGGDRVLQFASIGFDVAAEEIFPSWAAGATVVLRPPGPPPDIAAFLQFVERQRITVLNLPAAYWHEWVREMEQTRAAAPPATLRLVIVGNERVSAAALRSWNERVQNIRWLNAYGPTEATITATIYEPATIPAIGRGDSVPIGRPIANVRAYVLDAQRRALPVGGVGDLYLGGSGLASGYLNDPSLTAERFIPNPFDDDDAPGSRLYRTGDRTRWRADGNLEFLGRLDAQIKLRGFRIEPAEIETALTAHAGVGDAAVVAQHNDASQNAHLVAYVALNTAPRPPLELWPSVGEYPLYDEFLYFAMTSDQPRNRIYQAAIDRLVPGRTVVEIGTGSDAILARFCAEAGAMRVYAIETSAEACQSARRRIAQLGLADRVTVIHGDCRTIELPERVDVCVSEIIGTIASSEGAPALLNDARRRFLKDDGVMIPSRCVTRVAAVSLPPDVAWQGAGFSQISAGYLTRLFDAVGHRFDVRLCLKHLQETDLISDAAVFEELKFSDALPLESQVQVSLNILRSCLLTGVVLWIELETVDGARIDTLRDQTSWLPVYFPLFDTAVPVAAGDTLRARCTSSLSDNGINPDYWMRGTLHRATGEPISFDHQSLHHGRHHLHDDFYKRWLTQPVRLRQETQRPTPASLRESIEQHLPAYMVPTSFVLMDRLPRTASGKLDRAALPRPGLQPAEASRPFQEPHTQSQQILARIWSAVLNVPRISTDDNFFDLGGDSILALQIVARAREANLHLTLEQLFKFPTLSALAALATPVSATPAKQLPSTGPAPLTPIQRWFFDQALPDPHHYNQAMLLDVSPALGARQVEEVFQYVMARHDALHLRFTNSGPARSQRVQPKRGPLPFTHRRLTDSDAASRRRAIADQTAQEQAGLNLEHGPLARAILFHHSDHEPSQLLIVIHHLAVDGVSWRILLEDLELACRALLNNQTPSLPVTTSSFVQWATHLAEHAESPAVTSELDFWRGRPWSAVRPLPVDFPNASNSEASAATLTVALEIDETRSLLREMHQAYHTRINDVLLAALAQVLTHWTNSRVVLLDLEGHGRDTPSDNLDLSRTVGWFTAVFPAVIELPPDCSDGDALKSVKEQLASVPRHGIGFGLLRYLNSNLEIRHQLRSLPQAQVAFNYFGQVDGALAPDALLRPSLQEPPAQRSPRQMRSHLIEINAMVRAQRLEVAWTFGRTLHRQSTIQSLADQYLAALRSLIAHARTAAAQQEQFTPSDFPLAGVDQKQLDRLVGRLRQQASPGATS
jgi:amino acid adenylation domain-containing protein/non-ribosomal peptide synthase protein (TIGR01720 family)